MRIHVERHLIFGRDWKLRQIGERLEIGGLEFRGFEFRAVKSAVLVEIRNHRGELLVLDIGDALARRAF